MGHGHVEYPPIPNFRNYKVEDVPELLKTQKKLALLGLRDPWLRNEVWKYQVYGENSYLKLWKILRGGMLNGLVVAVVATVISKTFARKVEHH